jgi:hypothetical protein
MNTDNADYQQWQRQAEDHNTCPCGEPVTTPVVVHWADGDSTYRYCEMCAAEILAYVGGTDAG